MALIHLSDRPEPIEAGPGPILESALDAGIPFPHGCSSGECGSCKCELLEGEVRSDKSSPEALTGEESLRGLILACCARPIGDVRIRCLAASAALPVVKFDASVLAIDRPADDVVLVTLSIPDGMSLKFRPGQFARLRFGQLPSRSYSMANGSGEGHLVFHIRILPEGRVSQYVAEGLEPGNSVEVQGPFGDAYWDGRPGKPLLLLAGGTGLAPILSVLSAALADGHEPESIHVYHGVRSQADLYAGDLLLRQSKERNFTFVPVYSQGDDRCVRRAHLHEAVAEDSHALHEASIYVAGPPPMVEGVRALALSRGAAAERIRADAFFAATPEKKSVWERIASAIGVTA